MFVLDDGAHRDNQVSRCRATYLQNRIVRAAYSCTDAETSVQAVSAPGL
jgi:hypothetical protein